MGNEVEFIDIFLGRKLYDYSPHKSRYISCSVYLMIFLTFLGMEGRLWNSKALCYIGNISYLLYLLHIYPVRVIDVTLGKVMWSNFVTAVIAVCFAEDVWNST